MEKAKVITKPATADIYHQKYVDQKAAPPKK